MSSLSQFFMGTPGQFQQRSRLGPDQQQGYQQLQNAAQSNGGAFNTAADYYRDLLSNNPSSLQAMIAPEMRNFNQNIIPGIAEQFSGYGSFGGLNSSGFRNATLNAGTDLAERIANMRANLQQQGAQGLQQIGEKSLGDYFNNIYSPRTPGALETLGPAIMSAIGGLAGPATGGLSALLPMIMQLFNRGGGNNGIQDQFTQGQYAAGPNSQGATYNPYTGVQG